MKKSSKTKTVSKSSGLLRGIAIAWLVISVLAIIVRLPIGEDKEYMDGQFWTYMVVSIINAYFAFQLWKKGRELANVAMMVIGLTYIATEIAIRLTQKGVTIADGIADLFLPAILIVIIYSGKLKKY